MTYPDVGFTSLSPPPLPPNVNFFVKGTVVFKKGGVGDNIIGFGVSIYPMAGVLVQSKYGPPFLIDRDRGSRLYCSINGCKSSCFRHSCTNMESLLISVINMNLIMTIRIICQTFMIIYMEQIGPRHDITVWIFFDWGYDDDSDDDGVNYVNN